MCDLLHGEHSTTVLPLPAVAVHAQRVRAQRVEPACYAEEGHTQPELPAQRTEEVLEREVAHTEPDAGEGTVNVAHRGGEHEGCPGVHVLLAVPALPADRASAEVGLMVRVHAQGAEAQVGAGTLDARDRRDRLRGALGGRAAENAGQHD